MENIISSFSLLFGLLVGSFLNALIYRLPRNINIAYPRSSCPSCNKIIAWYENVPVFSYLYLRGKCSGCGVRISWQYPVVEVVSSVAALLLAPRSLESGDLFNFFFFFSVFCVFLVHFIVDLKHQILPDSLNVYLAALFLIVSVFNFPWTHWFLGGVIGFGFPLIVSWLFYQIKGQIGLGGGDIKLYGALGIYLGPIGVMQNLFLSCLIGAIIGGTLILTKVIKKETPIPFGPFILIVGALQIFANGWFESLMSYIP